MKITKTYLKQIIKESIEEIKRNRDTGPINPSREIAQKAAGTAGLTPVGAKESIWKDMDPQAKQEILDIFENSAGKKYAYYMEHEKEFPDGSAKTNLEKITEEYNFLISLGYQPRLLKERKVPVANVFTERLAGYLIIGEDNKAQNFEPILGKPPTWKSVEKEFGAASDDDEEIDEGLADYFKNKKTPEQVERMVKPLVQKSVEMCNKSAHILLPIVGALQNNPNMRKQMQQFEQVMSKISQASDAIESLESLITAKDNY
jgi:hypothetical protein